MTAAVAPEKPELPRGAGTSKKNGAAGAASLGSVAKDYVARVRGGELGAIPAVLGLIVLCVFFSALRPVFLSELNFANLLTQGAGSIAIAMGLVFVLLLGEIDLSAGYASGVCAAVLAILLTDHGWPWYGAVGAAILSGTVIGLVLGLLVAKVGIPSFVVTLAAFLGFQGIVLMLLKEGTNVSIRDETILAVANNNLAPAAGWILLAVSVGVYTAIQLRQSRNRRRRGLAPLHRPCSQQGSAAWRCSVRSPSICSTRNAAATSSSTPSRACRSWCRSSPSCSSPVRSCSSAPRSVCTSTRWAVTPRRPAGRHQRRGHPHLRVRHLLLPGSGRRHHRRVPGQLGRPQHRWQQRAAAGGRRGRDRRDEPVRRAGQGHRRRARRHGRRRHPERHGTHGVQLRGQVRCHGFGSAGGRRRGCAVPSQGRTTMMSGVP